MLNCCDHLTTNTTLRTEPCCFKVPFRRVTHVIFNVDGTVLDNKTMIRNTLQEICQQHEKSFADRFHVKTEGILVKDIAKMLIEELELPITEEEFVEAYNDLIQQKCGDVDLMPGVYKLVKHFHSHDTPMAAVTSASEEQVQLMSQNHRKVFFHLSHVVCGASEAELENGKPAPDIYQMCASKFEEPADPSRCLVFEDSSNGVHAALAAGMQVVMVVDENVPYEIWKDATMRVESLFQIPPELFGLPPYRPLEMPLQHISFTIDLEGCKMKRPPKIWQKIRAEVREAIEKETGWSFEKHGKGKKSAEEEEAKEPEEKADGEEEAGAAEEEGGAAEGAPEPAPEEEAAEPAAEEEAEEPPAE